MLQDKLKFTGILIVIASFICAALAFLIPVASTVADPLMAHVRTAFAVVLGVLYGGSALWFFSALKSFKTRLRVAYSILGAGLIMFSIAMLQLPVFGLFDLWHTAWATGGGAILVFVIATLLFYIAMRQLARLLEIRGPASSMWFVLGVTVAFSVLWGVVGAYFVQYELEGVEIYVGAVGATISFFFFSAFLVMKILRNIGQSYQGAMKWLAAGLFCLMGSAIHEATTTLFMTTGNPYQDYGLYLIPFILSGLVMVQASYEFRALTEITSAEENGGKASAKDSDYVDSIVTLAGLASRPQEIDSLLDDLRLITANLKPGSTLTEGDKQKLVDVYYRLETYLTKDDPLRSFTRDDLRKHVNPRFSAALRDTTTTQ